MRLAAVFICLCLIVAACGDHVRTAPIQQGGAGIPSSLLSRERPIGRGPRFQPANLGRPNGRCTATLGPRQQAHIEVFGADRVVLLAAGIGTQAPRRFNDGRLVAAACFGELVTLDPTGTVYFRGGSRVTLGALFHAWGQRLTASRVGSFGGSRVRVYVNGRERDGNPRQVPLTAGAEIVLEVGPPVPPHTHFTFPPKPSTGLR